MQSINNATDLLMKAANIATTLVVELSNSTTTSPKNTTPSIADDVLQTYLMAAGSALTFFVIVGSTLACYMCCHSQRDSKTGEYAPSQFDKMRSSVKNMPNRIFTYCSSLCKKSEEHIGLV